jgi:hypothetical protein
MTAQLEEILCQGQELFEAARQEASQEACETAVERGQETAVLPAAFVLESRPTRTGMFDMSGIGVDDGKLRFTFNGIATLGVVGGIVCIVLGYKLFGQPVVAGTGSMTAKVAHGMADIGITGSWPGIFFMGFGSIIIIVGMLSASLGQSFGPPPKPRKKAKRDAP